MSREDKIRYSFVVLCAVILLIFAVHYVADSANPKTCVGDVQRKYILKDGSGEFSSQAVVIMSVMFPYLVKVDRDVFDFVQVGHCYRFSQSFFSDVYDLAVPCE